MAANANLNELMPDLYEGLHVASREITGLIQSVNTSTGAARAAIGETVKIPTGSAGDVIDTPVGFDAPVEGNSNVGAGTMEITKSKTVQIDYKGEDQQGLRNSGQFSTVFAQQFSDAVRKLVNQIEIDVANEAVAGASRAYGTAGTAPFADGSKMTDLANLKAILDANGTPATGRTLVLSPEAELSMLTNQANFFKVNEAGSDLLLRQGIVAPAYGFNIRSSFGLQSHTAGTGTGYKASAAFDKGDYKLSLTPGTGTVLPGDVVTFAGDTNKYIVNAGGNAASAITLGKPGLKAALASGAAMTVGGSYTPSVALHRGAVALALRAPALPTGGDSAIDSTLITDPETGITFEVRVYAGQRCLQYQVSIAYGVKAVNGEHIAVLLG